MAHALSSNATIPAVMKNPVANRLLVRNIAIKPAIAGVTGGPMKKRAGKTFELDDKPMLIAEIQVTKAIRNPNNRPSPTPGQFFASRSSGGAIIKVGSLVGERS